MRIGIFGGAFDPIHNGHLALAQAAIKELKLDQFFFVPSNQSPLKTPNKDGTAGALRFQMVKESIQEIPGFYVSDIELKRKGISYTVDTLLEFQKEFPKPHELFFIAGSDWMNRLNEWKDFNRILLLCRFVVATRPGFQLASLPKGVEALNFAALDISATKLRDMIRREESVDTWIPKPALKLIKTNRLYQN